MNRPIRGVNILLDELRTLRFDVAAIRAFERKTGKSFIPLVARGQFSIDDLVLLVWAGLRAEDPDVTDQQVEVMLDESKSPLVDVATAIVKAVFDHPLFKAREVEKEGDDDPNAPRAPETTEPGLSPASTNG